MCTADIIFKAIYVKAVYKITLLSSKWVSFHLIPFNNDGHQIYQKYFYTSHKAWAAFYFQDQSGKDIQENKGCRLDTLILCRKNSELFLC
jgi:hypothetical protein